ncbi:MAG: HD domain-containing protein [bacterium]|nr:HD domain-containing protein [bacterium]
MEMKIKVSAANSLKTVFACGFAYGRHGSQCRLNGELHIEHVLRVAQAAAEYVLKNHLSEEDEGTLVLSAVLHDVLEDTPTSDEEVSLLFGNEVARITRALSHVEEEESDEVYLGRIKAAGRIAVLVKRFDRLDNLRSLQNAPVEFRARKLVEIRKALSLWHEIDSDGAPLIEKLLQEVEHESATC